MVGKNPSTEVVGTSASRSAAARDTRLPPAAAPKPLRQGARPRVSRARISARARAGRSASPAPTAPHKGATGSARPARTPHATPPSSLAAVTTQAMTSPSAPSAAARMNTRASQPIIRAGGYRPEMCPRKEGRPWDTCYIREVVALGHTPRMVRRRSTFAYAAGPWPADSRGPPIWKHSPRQAYRPSRDETTALTPECRHARRRNAHHAEYLWP